ncbi:hypothetical protein AX16_000558 [Volvariella volvacea WC 439]|nr:hypothetical protein AX16_000558 [Volvariella volvacea WC 439]
MDSYSDITTPLWDLSQATSFSRLPDDDFIALLQKQFPTANGLPHNSTNPLTQASINPQNISRYSLSSLTPPSEDSSPSPPHTSADQTSQQASPSYEEGGDSVLKRKASIEPDDEEGPSQKSQHTLNSSKKASTTTGSRRKSTTGGTTTKDESRLLKRKEQNRAAQRAFRERKEKHVKDLEDKVAALEAKNEQATTENENLRDLLTRLQTENVLLKQSSFTFAVPKPAGVVPNKLGSMSTEASPFASASHTSSSISSPVTGRATSPPKAVNPLDWSSLTSFDPAILNLLDDQPQPTATASAMQMNFGFDSNYTTIANNTMFTSFASAFDSATPAASDPNAFNFDLNSLSSWPSPPSVSQDQVSLDEIFAPYLGGPSPYQYPASTPGISPVAHHTVPAAASSTQSPGASSSSSPSSSGSDGVIATPKDTPSSMAESEIKHDPKECPKTRAEVALVIEKQGLSSFAPPKSNIKKTSDGTMGPTITCQGSSSFPKTMASKDNVEVLQAWRTITSDPKFKDCDINELCSEFTSKARCDGTKVVLEPQGVNHILETLSARHQ